jgi:hypothetical protein
MTYPIGIHCGSSHNPGSIGPNRLIYPNRRGTARYRPHEAGGGDPPQPKAHVHFRWTSIRQHWLSKQEILTTGALLQLRNILKKVA